MLISRMLVRASRITPKKRNLLLKAFCTFDMTAALAAEHAHVSRNCANQYYNHFREKIADSLRMAPRFVGEVEMDTAVFGKGVKRPVDKRVIGNIQGYGDFLKKRSRKSIRPNNRILLFGIMQRQGKVYTRIINKADRDTLFPIIHLVVEPGATVYTDKWAGFNDLQIDGYTHRPVNHSQGPVGLDGAHTGNIDAFWGFTKRHLGNFRGISRRTFPLHLKECELRYNVRDKKELLKLVKSLSFPRKQSRRK